MDNNINYTISIKVSKWLYVLQSLSKIVSSKILKKVMLLLKNKNMYSYYIDGQLKESKSFGDCFKQLQLETK